MDTAISNAEKLHFLVFLRHLQLVFLRLLPKCKLFYNQNTDRFWYQSVQVSYCSFCVFVLFVLDVNTKIYTMRFLSYS